MDLNEIIMEGHRTVFRVMAHEVDAVARALRPERNISGYGRGRGRFDKSPNVSRPRVTSRTVSRDATRCYYCKEPGHISRFCERREDNENRLKRGSSNMMANIGSQFKTVEAYENYKDLYNEQVEYLNN